MQPFFLDEEAQAVVVQVAVVQAGLAAAGWFSGVISDVIRMGMTSTSRMCQIRHAHSTRPHSNVFVY